MIGSGFLKGIAIAVVLAALAIAVVGKIKVRKPVQDRAPVSNCGHFERQILNLPSCDK